MRARSKLVTIDARNLEVRQVIRKLAWQSWESILVHPSIRGRVTLSVQDKPLAEVLDLVARQTHSRFLMLHPLYSSRPSLRGFVMGICEPREPVISGWSNLSRIIQPEPPRGGPRLQTLKIARPLTLQVTNCDLRLVTLAYSRFANLQVVPEDGTPSQVTLNLHACPMPRAVEALARQANRRTRAFFSLLPSHELGPGGGPPPGPGMGPMPPPPPPGGGPPPGPGPGLARNGPPLPQPPSRKTQQQMERDFQELMAILPKEQRDQLESERSFHEAMQGFSPEQREQYEQQQRADQPPPDPQTQPQSRRQADQQQQAQSQSSSSSSSSSLQESRREGLRDSTVDDRVSRDRQENPGP